jgi:hypothetical protein
VPERDGNPKVADVAVAVRARDIRILSEGLAVVTCQDDQRLIGDAVIVEQLHQLA